MYWEITKFHQQIYCTTVAMPDLPGAAVRAYRISHISFDELLDIE
jgi:hypothetical protein